MTQMTSRIDNVRHIYYCFRTQQ